MMSVPTVTRTRRPSTRPTVPNILRVYGMATLAELDAGLSWYRDAHALACKLDPTDPRRAAGVLAALSPCMPWGRNVNLAARAYADGYASGAMLQSCRAADAILAGADPDDVLRGPKTRAFCQLIADPDDGTAVVIDRHAFDVAAGRVTDDRTREQLARAGQYRRWADAYRRAAAILSADSVPVTPAQVQGVTWVVWRRLKGIVD